MIRSGNLNEIWVIGADRARMPPESPISADDSGELPDHLGGWRDPFLSEELGPLRTILKILALSFVVIWARVAYPRLREDQLQRLAWQGLVPIALGQLVLTGVVVSVNS